MSSIRRSDFDVTNTVQVSSPPAVLAAVEALFRPTWPELSTSSRSCTRSTHFERLFAGEVPGFHGVDTVYHDRQHTLDITLALARLLVGLRAAAAAGARASAARVRSSASSPGCFTTSVTCAAADDRDSRNGAEFTRTHVSRGARFLEEYLPELGLAHWVAGRHPDHALHRLRSALRAHRGAGAPSRATSCSATCSARPT